MNKSQDQYFLDVLSAYDESLSLLGNELFALKTVVRILIETHPDPMAVASALDRQRLQSEAVLGPTPLPDSAIDNTRQVFDEMKAVAMHAHSKKGKGPQSDPGQK